MEEVIDTNVTNLSKYIIKVVLPEPNEEYEDILKEKVFETIDEFESVECDYLIAYVPDIVWGDTLDILKNKL